MEVFVLSKEDLFKCLDAFPSLKEVVLQPMQARISTNSKRDAGYQPSWTAREPLKARSILEEPPPPPHLCSVEAIKGQHTFSPRPRNMAQASRREQEQDDQQWGISHRDRQAELLASKHVSRLSNGRHWQLEHRQLEQAVVERGAASTAHRGVSPHHLTAPQHSAPHLSAPHRGNMHDPHRRPQAQHSKQCRSRL
jgi:hypothetical protein